MVSKIVSVLLVAGIASFSEAGIAPVAPVLASPYYGGVYPYSAYSAYPYAAPVAAVAPAIAPAKVIAPVAAPVVAPAKVIAPVAAPIAPVAKVVAPVAPAFVTARSSQVIARNYNAAAVPVAAPIAYAPYAPYAPYVSYL